MIYKTFTLLLLIEIRKFVILNIENVTKNNDSAVTMLKTRKKELERLTTNFFSILLKFSI